DIGYHVFTMRRAGGAGQWTKLARAPPARWPTNSAGQKKGRLRLVRKRCQQRKKLRRAGCGNEKCRGRWEHHRIIFIPKLSLLAIQTICRGLFAAQQTAPLIVPKKS